MNLKTAVLATVLLFAFAPTTVYGLTCSSPKKGAASTPLNNNLGISNFYNYWPYSSAQNTTPMLKRGHINHLRVYQDTVACSLNGCTMDNATPENCCPAKMIQDTIKARGPGGYWLIFNEPFSEDEYGDCINHYPCRSTAAADDAAFAIAFIKNLDPSAKFIVGWYSDNPRFPFTDPSTGKETQDIISQWPGPSYGLNADINQVITGWHLHLYDTSADGSEIANHPLLTKSPGKEIWITEFGTLVGTDCRYDTIEANSNCLDRWLPLINRLENTNYVTKYFWWNYGPCDPQYLGGQGWRRDMCWGPLTKTDGSLNSLGSALAAIPNDGGVCRFGSAIPSPTDICPRGRFGNLNCSPDGLIDSRDLEILIESWDLATADLNSDNIVNETDLNILIANWGLLPVLPTATPTATATTNPLASPTPTPPFPNLVSCPTLMSVEDSFINEYLPDTNYDNPEFSNNQILLSKGTVSTSRRGLIKFDLSNLTTTFNSVFLRLYLAGWGGTNAAINVYQLKQPWNEWEVTWNRPVLMFSGRRPEPAVTTIG